MDAVEWTGETLRHRLIASSGAARGGGPNVKSVAGQLGISARTVQRWLSTEDDARVAMRPASAIAARERLRPSAQKLAQDQRDRVYAENAIRTLSVKSRAKRAPAAWREQQWLEPHLVVILEREDLYLRQVSVVRSEGRPITRLNRRPGKQIIQAEFETRFHALLALHQALEDVDPWRVRAVEHAFQQGHSQCWVTDAPEVRLQEPS